MSRKVSLTLSDPFCVDRHRAAFLDLVEHHVDVLFANEAEIRSLYEVDDFDAALQQVRRHCEVAALTRGPRGSLRWAPLFAARTLRLRWERCQRI